MHIYHNDNNNNNENKFICSLFKYIVEENSRVSASFSCNVFHLLI